MTMQRNVRGITLIGFAIMGGRDLGVGALLPFAARTDDERRVLLNLIGPTWEGNQVWLILGGGAIFAAFPPLYAVSFSGFYLAMIVILLALILRPVGFKFRGKISDPRWRATWDWALFVGGLVPALIMGVAVGNVLLGSPFHFDDSLRVFYTGNFLQLLMPFALLAGVVSLGMIVTHGAALISTQGEFTVTAEGVNSDAAGFALQGEYDQLAINGGDLGSTTTFDGGAGILDAIIQTGGTISDDSYVNVSNVEILTGTTAINATLGAEAASSGLVRIIGTAGNDVVLLDAAFNKSLTISLGGGDDTINATNAIGTITVNETIGNITAADTVIGGANGADTFNIDARGASATPTGDLTNVNGFEFYNVTADAGDVIDIDGDGVLTVVGRVKRFAKIAGEMVSLDVIEEVAREASPEHRHAVVLRTEAASGETTVLFTTDPALNRSAMVHAARQLGRPELALSRRILWMPEIPVLASGKTDYVAVQKLVEAETPA